MDRTRIKFEYTNHRGEDHVYLVAPTGVRFFQPYPLAVNPAWYLDCQVLMRDGEERPGIRSFRLDGMRNIQEVPRVRGTEVV